MTLKNEKIKCNVMLKTQFTINSFLFFFAHASLTCSFQHVISGNPVFFVPMTFVRTDIKFEGGFAVESVVSVEAVASHCRGKTEKEREEGGQVSAQCSSFKILTEHMYACIPSAEFKNTTKSQMGSCNVVRFISSAFHNVFTVILHALPQA